MKHAPTIPGRSTLFYSGLESGQPLAPVDTQESMVKTRKRILVVDDEPAILKILGIKLKLSGYDVITALDGQEALDLCCSASPDLMLLDIIMPRMDGFEVLQKLRTCSQLPVIAFSAAPDSAQKALKLGANCFIDKPFDVDDLVNRIQKLLDQKV